jgi:TDG/mug DNA glycosylase family protein
MNPSLTSDREAGSAAETRPPTRDELAAAVGRSLPDLIAPDLNILFCGVHPGLYSAAVQRHFARPGNRFWPALHEAGFTDRLLTPDENHELLVSRYGVTSLVARATATAREITRSELLAGAAQLRDKVGKYQPEWLAIMGIGAYRSAFNEPDAVPGLQPGQLAGSRIWLLPSPSGANGSYPLAVLIGQFKALRQASGSGASVIQRST